MIFRKSHFHRKRRVGERNSSESNISKTLTLLVLREKHLLNLSLSRSETTCIYLESDTFSPKSVDRIARNLDFCENILGKSAKHFRLDLPCLCPIKYCSSRMGINLRLYKPITTNVYLISRVLPKHSRNFLKAQRMIPDRFRENWTFHENLNFSESCPDTFSKRKFAQAMDSTQRTHPWIAYKLRKNRKLVRSGTNTQILRNLDFCDKNLHLKRAVNRQPSVRAGGM